MTKALCTIRARCALAGIALHVTTDDRGHPMFVASRWALTRTFESLAEVETWLCRVTCEKPTVVICESDGGLHE
jgi:hypothetical protein